MKLIKDKIYSCIHHSVSEVDRCIFKATDNNQQVFRLTYNHNNFWSSSSFNHSLSDIKEATLEEQHWLNECIKANKFIPLEEAMKSFKQENQFVVGKWYKINNCWWAKFKTIHGSGIYWRYLEAISKSKIYTNYPHNMLDWKDVSINLLTDLSEIQQYLPEGHVDKIKKSLVGRYVKWLQSKQYSKLFEKGEYSLIIEDTENCIRLDGSNTGFNNLEYNKDNWELMPEGFTPPNMKQSNIEQDLIAEAKRRYPVGTKYIAVPRTKSEFISQGNPHFIKKYEGGCSGEINIAVSLEGESRGLVYQDGVWAEVVNDVKKEQWIPEKGDYLYCHTDLRMLSSGLLEATAGKVYLCEQDGHFTNNSGNKLHGFGNIPSKWFRPATWYEQQEQKVSASYFAGVDSYEKPKLSSSEILNLINEPITIKKSKVQQVEVVPLQKPCIISTRKLKFKLQIN